MSFHEAPRIETERLVLRAYARSDFDAVHASWTDPVVMRHFGPRLFTREENWTRFLRNIALWPVLGYGYWAVEEKASGRFVGDVGVADFKRDMSPSIEGVPEIGWVLAAWAHGKGYATEAAQTALAWCDANVGSRTVCIISPENEASIRVANKCGYREIARIAYKEHAVILFERG